MVDQRRLATSSFIVSIASSSILALLVTSSSAICGTLALAGVALVSPPSSSRILRGTSTSVGVGVRRMATQLHAASAARNRRGLEQRREGATPTEGGMTLYVKAGPDGTSLGDCPFAHYVRLVLEAKGLEYELIPSVTETKPSWLMEHYDGKMPALRHRKECYVESDTIAAYLDFFFPKPELTAPEDASLRAAVAAVDGLFPAMAQYLKHTPDGDDSDVEKRVALEAKLATLNAHLSSKTRNGGGPYLVGDGSILRLNDCKLAPVLYHLTTAMAAFKGENAIDTAESYPAVQQYMDHMFATPEFQNTVYPAATVEWGWGNARKAS